MHYGYNVSFEGEDVASISGVIHNDIDCVRNWLKNQLYDPSEIPIETPCLIIKSLQVDPHYRGQSYGHDLLVKCLEENSHLPIWLEADLLERNTFNLVNWYKRHGFEPIKTKPDTILMKKYHEEIQN